MAYSSSCDNASTLFSASRLRKCSSIPQPIEVPRLGVAQHQPPQCFVLAVVERERDDFVDGDDLRVAEGHGKDSAEFLEGGRNPAAGRAAFVDDEWRRFGQLCLLSVQMLFIRLSLTEIGNRPDVFSGLFANTSSWTLPSRPALGSSEPTVTNSVPAARSAGKRTSMTEGA